MSKVNYIYIMSTVIEGKKFYKIGVSKDPEKRHKAVQTGCPSEVLLEHYEERDNAYKTEKYLHNEFQGYKTYGEWYQHNDLDLSKIRRKIFSHVIY